MKQFKIGPFVVYILVGLLIIYSEILLIDSRHALIKQQVVSDQQITLTNTQDAYIETLEGTIDDLKAALEKKYSAFVTATAYCQNDAKTAIGENPAPGTCAMPKKYLDTFPMGSDVLLINIGVYRVNNISGSDSIDIFIGNCKDATDFGIHYDVQATRIME